MKRMWVALSAALVLGSTPVHATVTLTGLSFDDNAFVDQILTTQGTWTNPTAVIGPNIFSYAQNNPPDKDAYLIVAFTDNSIVNGLGEDFVLFEAGGPGSPGAPGEPAKITVNGITNTYNTVWSGEGGAYRAFINLDDFGIPAGDRVAVIQLWGLYNDVSGTEYMAIGALNNGAPIPAPAAVWLLGSGLFTLVGIRRKINR